MSTLNVLLVEDSPNDADLVLRHLTQGGFQIFHARVHTVQTLKDALNVVSWDIVISDYSLSNMSVATAFSIVKGASKDLPFIIVSSAQGEYVAVETMRMGIHDYLMKDKLERLVEVVKRELGQAKNRKKLREKEEEFLQAQKMEVVGKLAGGIAHDFNNTLSVILLCTDNILSRNVDADTLRETKQIRLAVERATTLTRQLLAFGRKQVLQPRVVSMNPMITNLEKMLIRLLGENIILKTGLEPNLVMTKIDPGLFEQVVMNLVVNSRDAMPNGGRLGIQTENVQVPPGETIPPGMYARLSVIDTGIGIENRILNKIFDPFFTTKGQQKSTGLGLSTVHGIVAQSGGYVTVDSHVGTGTTFHIYLPKCDDKEIEQSEASVRPEEKSNLVGKKILLLEDEALLSEVIEEVLRLQGCHVFKAQSEIEVMRILEDKSINIDLVLSDVVMQELNGIQLLQKLVKRFPHLKMILMSAYMDKEIEKYHELQERILFLQKPFSLSQLIKNVNQVMSQG